MSQKKKNRKRDLRKKRKKRAAAAETRTGATNTVNENDVAETTADHEAETAGDERPEQ